MLNFTAKLFFFFIFIVEKVKCSVPPGRNEKGYGGCKGGIQADHQNVAISHIFVKSY